MPPPYHHAHWNAFSDIPFQEQGAVGVAPLKWVTRHGLAGVPDQAALSHVVLNREAVIEICREPAHDVLFAYACAMAWGGQGGGPGGRGHVAAAWNARAQLVPRLTALRAGGLSRSEAYTLFCGAGAVPGLGPSFFTKLLYFFSPAPSFYIMDQWTAKSVNLLTGTALVRLAGHAPSSQNQGGNYEAFCQEVDLMAGLLNCPGQVAEERLFSKGGRKRWPWRAYLRQHW